MLKSKYIGDRAFYRMTLMVAVPIMVQNFITNLVNMLDNLMVGSIGTEQMSAVSIVNQLVFVFNLAIFGALSGAGIFTAQFHGKDDVDGIRYTFRFKVIISVMIFVVAAIVFYFFGERLVGLYLHEASSSGGDLEATLGFSKQYLAIIIIGLLPFAISQTFSSTLRETGETLVPMFIGFVAVVTNCGFNYLLIFGKLGFPMLGVRGAAIATVISRYAECLIIVVYTLMKRKRFRFINGALKSLYIPRSLLKPIILKGMPLLLNEFLWALGMSLLSMGYSLHGIDVVAGYSISSTITNLFSIAFLSLGVSIGIIIGKELGAGRFEEAVEADRKLIAFSVTVSIVVGIAVFLLGGKITEFYNTSDESKQFAAYFIRVAACVLPINAFANASYFTLRSGGKTIITFLFDSVFVLAFSVPIAFLLYYGFKLSIWAIFPIVQSLETVKCVIGFILIKKRLWVNNIVD